MDNRFTFNEDAHNYDKWRPTYCEELFQYIFAYGQLGARCNVLEVGIGTGQATEPFLRAGCEVTAVELGEELAEYTRTKFQRYDNFRVVYTTFEQFAGEPESVDFLYSATAFHWIPEQQGYTKARELLKEGGTLALFWNRPFVSRQDDPLHMEIQRIYDTYRPSTTKIIEHETDKYAHRLQTIQSYGFRDVESKLYHVTRTFSAKDYIGLLNTYSDHRTMEASQKQALEQAITAAILNYGDILYVYDTIDLYVARK